MSDSNKSLSLPWWKALYRHQATEVWLGAVLLLACVGLSLSTEQFFTLTNLFDLLNASSINLIFAVGLLVVLIAGGIDISFAVGASVVQYIVATTIIDLGEEVGRWAWVCRRLLVLHLARLTPRLSTILGSFLSWSPSPHSMPFLAC